MQTLTKETFNYFRCASNKAGINKSTRGVSKINATLKTNVDETIAQFQAFSKWTDDKMQSLYTNSTDRVRLVKEAIKKLEK